MAELPTRNGRQLSTVMESCALSYLAGLSMVQNNQDVAAHQAATWANIASKYVVQLFGTCSTASRTGWP